MKTLVMLLRLSLLSKLVSLFAFPPFLKLFWRLFAFLLALLLAFFLIVSSFVSIFIWHFVLLQERVIVFFFLLIGLLGVWVDALSFQLSSSLLLSHDICFSQFALYRVITTLVVFWFLSIARLCPGSVDIALISTRHFFILKLLSISIRTAAAVL